MLASRVHSIVHSWEGMCNHLKEKDMLCFDLLSIFHLTSNPKTWMTIFVIHNCWLDETILNMVQLELYVGVGSAHKRATICYTLSPKDPAWIELHQHVQLGCPTLIYRHSTLCWIFITTTTTKKFLLLWLLYTWINKVISFCDMILTQGNFQQ